MSDLSALPAGLFGEPVLAGHAPRGLGRAMAGGGDKVNRQPNDFYPTPADVTRALMRVEAARIAEIATGPVWEPCGRGGAIINVLIEAGFETIGSDIVPDPAHGVAELDLLQARVPLARKAVTNPPFVHAAAMIAVLLERMQVDYLAMLVKSQFWHADERRALFRRTRPARIWALTWRPDFLGGGAPTMECQWVVWERGFAGPTSYDLLPRQGDAQKVLL